MKIKTIILTITVCILLFNVQTQAATQTMLEPGDRIDYYLNSDIVTYINEYPIKSYNINGYTVIIAEDLVNYGFNIFWDSEARTLTIDRDNWKTPNSNYKIEKTPESMNGSIAGYVLFTDIKCYYYRNMLIREIRGFNIGGYTAIYVDDLAKVYGDSYIYNDDDRTLKLNLVKNWVSDEYSRGTDKKEQNPNIMTDGCSYTFTNNTQNLTEFILTEWSNTYDFPLGSVGSFGSDYFTFVQSYSDIEQLGGNPDFFEIINDNINIRYGTERIADDTPKRRKALAEVFRIYMNDELVSGELNYQQGNNSYYYQFIFDKSYGLDDIKTIRFELGYK